MMKQARAELDVDPIRGVGKQIGAQDSQCGFEHRDRTQSENQDIEGGQRPVHQHLVDHYLEKERRNQSEQLQEERCDQHLAEQVAIFMDRT
jgi:hypothetical protein